MIMNCKVKMAGVMCVIVMLLQPLLCLAVTATDIEDKAREAEQMEQLREDAARARREELRNAKLKALEKANLQLEENIAQISLPLDSTQRFTVKEVIVSGNTLVSTDELF